MRKAITLSVLIFMVLFLGIAGALAFLGRDSQAFEARNQVPSQLQASLVQETPDALTASTSDGGPGTTGTTDALSSATPGGGSSVYEEDKDHEEEEDDEEDHDEGEDD